MKRYENREELVRAYGEKNHNANLEYGGVFNEKDERISNLETEIKWAEKKVVYVHEAYSKMIANLPEELTAWYIRGFGYCEA
jgi:hypothetical protein